MARVCMAPNFEDSALASPPGRHERIGWRPVVRCGSSSDAFGTYAAGRCVVRFRARAWLESHARRLFRISSVSVGMRVAYLRAFL